MARSSIAGQVLVAPSRFFTSFTEILLLLIILFYEGLCFFLLTMSSLSVGRFVETFVKTLVSPHNKSAAFQSTFAILFFPMATFVFEIVEDRIIRPAINRAKATYPFILVNVPPLMSILLMFLAFWNVVLAFHDRFDIFIDETAVPMKCFLENSKLMIRVLLPIREGWLPIQTDILVEAGSTTKFLISLFYLNYFLWKWALKYVPYSAFALSNSAIMSLQVNFVLTLLTLLSAGLLENLAKGLGFPLDLLMIPIAIGIAGLGHLCPWNVIFDGAARAGDEEGDGVKIERRIGPAIHGLFFLLGTIGLVFVFFGVEMDEGFYSKLDLRQVISPERKRQIVEKIREEGNSVKWSTGAFRGIFGFQILMFIRTLFPNSN